MQKTGLRLLILFLVMALLASALPGVLASSMAEDAAGEEVTPPAETASGSDSGGEASPTDTDPTPSPAATPTPKIPISEEIFPDAGFRAMIADTCDANMDGSLSRSEISRIKELSCEEKDFVSLKGVEYLTELESLTCYGNRLEALDLSGNAKLTFVNCANNALRSLILGENPSLLTLICDYNRLGELDISGCPALSRLICDGNELTQLDLTACPALRALAERKETEGRSFPVYYFESSVGHAARRSDVYTEITLSLAYDKGVALTPSVSVEGYFRLSFDPLGGSMKMNISDRVAEYWRDPNDHEFRAMSLSMGEPVDMDADYLTPTREGYLFDGWYSTAGSDSNAVRGVVTFTSNNALTARWTTPESIGSVPIDADRFPDDAFRAFVGQALDGNGDGVLDGRELAGTEEIDCSERQIASLAGIEYFPMLQTLNCGGNRLTSLELYGNDKLRSLNCSNNALTTLDLSPAPLMNSLSCAGNPDLTVDISVCPLLREVYTEGECIEAGAEAEVLLYRYLDQMLRIDRTAEVVTDPPADVNGDGVIDAPDAARLLSDGGGAACAARLLRWIARGSV